MPGLIRLAAIALADLWIWSFFFAFGMTGPLDPYCPEIGVGVNVGAKFNYDDGVSLDLRDWSVFQNRLTPRELN